MYRKNSFWAISDAEWRRVVAPFNSLREWRAGWVKANWIAARTKRPASKSSNARLKTQVKKILKKE